MKLKCKCGGEPVLKLSLDNEWYIYCPKCKEYAMDYADRRTQTIRVKYPRKELYKLWEIKQNKKEIK